MNILKDIKAVIFDLDGTLVDSMWMWKDIDIEYLEKYGHSLPKDLQEIIEGMSFTETAVYFKDRFGLSFTIEEIKKEWNEMALYKYTHQVPLKEGAGEFLKFLTDSGIKLGIATSNSRELADAVIKKLDIKKYFHSIRTSCEAPKGKPAPDVYLMAASDLKVEPSDCLVFEDVPHGILAGKNAGMKVCAVYDEFTEGVTHEKKELADYYIENFYELGFCK